MNTVQRFFRRYIFSMVGIMVLFFAVNVALLSAIMIIPKGTGSRYEVHRIPCQS